MIDRRHPLTGINLRPDTESQNAFYKHGFIPYIGRGGDHNGKLVWYSEAGHLRLHEKSIPSPDVFQTRPVGIQKGYEYLHGIANVFIHDGIAYLEEMHHDLGPFDAEAKTVTVAGQCLDVYTLCA